MTGRWDGSVVCPVCWQETDVFDGLIRRHGTGRCTEGSLSIRCVVEKITLEQAWQLEADLVRAAHP